jgi:altronate dehydratase small subunit
MEPAMTSHMLIGADALALSPIDNIVTALRGIVAGELIAVECDGVISELEVAQAIPFGHKISLQAIAAGDMVRKYGEDIGYALQSIPAGYHVHVHNMRSNRAKG